jgi:hypothetical protein
MLGKATWDKLFEPPNFFLKYRYVDEVEWTFGICDAV